MKPFPSFGWRAESNGISIAVVSILNDKKKKKALQGQSMWHGPYGVWKPSERDKGIIG